MLQLKLDAVYVDIWYVDEKTFSFGYQNDKTERNANNPARR